MRDEKKTKQELIEELAQTRRQIAELTAPERGEEMATSTCRKNKNLAQILLNVTEDAAVLISADGVLLCANEVAAAKLGQPVASLIGKNLFQSLPPDVAADRRMRILEAIRSGMPIRSVDMKEGVFTETVVNPISSLGGKVEMLAVFSRDVTAQMKADLELRKAKEAAESADLAKTRFLANMSHELRTPLNAIIGFSEILESETFGPLNQRQSGYIRSVAYSGHHLLELVNDVLDLTKVESGKMELHISEVNVCNVVECSLAMVTQSATKQGITIHQQIDEVFRNHVFQADERKLLQVLSNLLANAVKFTPYGGNIEVEVRIDQDEVVLSVSDTGIGLKLEDQDPIFRPFFQVDSSFARTAGGTGLGLALCKRLVELHGGRIWVESEGIGRGSKFVFTVPLAGLRKIVDQLGA
jgi:signal transduction histidine kinase